jgi:hypothetical protein
VTKGRRERPPDRAAHDTGGRHVPFAREVALNDFDVALGDWSKAERAWPLLERFRSDCSPPASTRPAGP